MEKKEKAVMEKIDLGLPSGLLWGSCNLGASSSLEAGDCFRWGDIVDYFDSKEEAYSSTVVKKYKDIDNNKEWIPTLEIGDDIAHILLGDGWRIPSKEDCLELYQNTDIFLVMKDGEEEVGLNLERVVSTDSYYGVHFKSYSDKCTGKIIGCKFYKKGDHSVNIFLPAFGWVDKDRIKYNKLLGIYWTCSNDLNSDNEAYSFGFTTGILDIDSLNINKGLYIRPVYTK